MLRPAIFESSKPAFFDNMFDHFFESAFTDFWGNGMAGKESFNTDVIDQGDHYLLQAELPGFKKEEINIDLSNNSIIISADHEEISNSEQPNYIRKERRYSSYKRSFHVEGIKPEDIDANYHDGILDVRFPKTELPSPEEPRKIEVK